MPSLPTETKLKRPTAFVRRTLSGNIERIRAEGEEPEDDSAIRYEFTASSEAEVEMWPGIFETLGHDESEVRMDWLNSGNAPVLWMHDRSQPRAIIESARIEDKKIIVTVRMSPNATDLIRDIDAGIIRNVSIGYRVFDEKLIGRKEDENGNLISATWRSTDWEPGEVSFVTLPADRSVGMGREEQSADEMSRDKFLAQRAQLATDDNTPPPIMSNTAPTITEDDVTKRAADAVTAERKRISAIDDIVAKTREKSLGDFSDAAREFVERGASVAEFQKHVLENMERMQPVTTQSLGLTDKEQKRYSLVNVLDGLATGDKKLYEFEREVSRAAQERNGHGDADRVCIPADVVMRGWIPQNPAVAAAKFGISERALLSVTLTGSGQDDQVANLVATDLLADLYIESLREHSVLLNRATILAGLVGDVDIPIELVNPEFYWIGEDAEPTEGVWESGLVQFRFKTIAARIPMTRRAIKQSTPNIESLIAANLRKGAGLSLEKAAWHGTSSATRPGGILNTNGIGSVATSGTLSFAAVQELRADVAGANAPVESCEFFTNSIGVRRFRETAIEEGDSARIGEWQNGTLYVEGRRVNETNLIPSNLGNDTDESAILFGDPSSLYVGMWGGLELAVDTATKAATGGKVIRVFQDADMKVPQPARWSAIQDLT